MRWLLAALALLLTAAPAAAQTLWQNANVGDSVAAIQGKFPAAVPSAKPSTLHDGAQCTIQIPGYEVVGKHFTVCFFFLQGKLSQVTLTLADPARGAAAKPIFLSVLDVLRAKYGKENKLEQDNGILTRAEAGWYRDPINISLLMIYVGEDDEGVLNINYQTRIAQDAKKL